MSTENTQLKKFDESAAALAMQKISELQEKKALIIPPNYSAENAIRVAWLMILQTVDRNKRPVLETCSRESIANALQEMVINGLNPSKSQCYFIAYGNTLTMRRSIYGKLAIAKRVAGVKDAYGVPIYEADVFAYERVRGRITNVSHDQKFENIDPDKVKGAYAVAEYEDGSVEYEVMTIKQIRSAWAMNNQRDDDSNNDFRATKANKNFADEMAAKTCLGRLLKIDINSSDDSSLYDKSETLHGQIKAEIADNGNREALGFDDDVQTFPVPTATITEQPQPEAVTQPAAQQQEQGAGQQIKVPF